MFQIRLKELREKAGYSQYSFAAAFGVAQSTVGSWESGVKEPRNYDTTRRLADFFNVSTDYLLGHTDDPAVSQQKSPVYDDEALELMEAMHKRPELKVLFSTSRNAKKEDVEMVDQILKKMAGNVNDE